MRAQGADAPACILPLTQAIAIDKDVEAEIRKSPALRAMTSAGQGKP
jgi:hypothetical protein